MATQASTAVILGAAAVALYLLYESQGGFDTSQPSGAAYPSVTNFAQAIAQAEGFGVAGAIPTQANNPGDLKIPGWTGPTLGAEGISVFSSVAEGWQRLYNQLNLIVNGTSKVYTLDMTITEMAAKWTDTQTSIWAANVAVYLGVSPDAPLSSVLGAF